MAGILGEHTTDLSIRIYDGEEATDRALMTGPFIGRNVSSRFLSTNRLEVASHYWTLVVGSTPSFENSLDQKRPQLLAIAGVGGSFLSTLLAWLLIHGRTRALKMALKHETRYKHLMQHAADTILVLDLNQRILEANEPAFTYFGHTLEELRQLRFEDLHPPQCAAEVEQRFEALKSSGAARFETTHRRKDGSVFPAEVSAQVVRFENETLVLCFIRDITEAKRVQEELRLLLDAAQAANKAKSTFLASMSYEIRTPLNSILGFSQLLIRDPGLTAQQRQNIETLQGSGEYLLLLINDILELAKIEAGRVTLNPGVFDLASLVEDLKTMFGPRIKSSQVQLVIPAADSFPPCLVTDGRKLRQVLVNLLSNAVKFTSQGQIILRIALQTTSAGPWRLRAEVEDTGPGIAPEELGKLFQSFERTASGIRAGGGTGLGLAISREFVRLMGGELRVRSQWGIGSVFFFEIPVKPGEQETLPKPSSDDLPAPAVAAAHPALPVTWSLHALPADLCAEIHHSVLVADFELLTDQIDKVITLDAPLGHHLRDLAAKFDSESLLQLTDQPTQRNP